jgi:hypothetical protein
MAIAFVQAATQVDVSGSSTTAPTIAITATGGNAILPVAHIGDFGGTTLSLTNITDGGNTYTARTAQHTDAFERTIAIAGFAVNVTGGARTVTFNLANTSGGANRYYVLGCLEYSGIDTAAPQDATASTSDINTGGGTDCSAGTITTTDAGDLIYGTAGIGGSGDTNINWGSPTSWTNRYRQNDASTYFGMDSGTWLPGSTQTTYTAQWSHDNTSGEEGCAVVVALKPASGGGGGRTTRNTRAFPLGMEIGMNWRS